MEIPKNLGAHGLLQLRGTHPSCIQQKQRMQDAATLSASRLLLARSGQNERTPTQFISNVPQMGGLGYGARTDKDQKEKGHMRHATPEVRKVQGSNIRWILNNEVSLLDHIVTAQRFNSKACSLQNKGSCSKSELLGCRLEAKGQSCNRDPPQDRVRQFRFRLSSGGW